MEITHRRVDEARKIVQITTTDERWYTREQDGRLIIRASVSWITAQRPKGKGFEKYQQRYGEYADVIRDEAGARGTKVHNACNDLLAGKPVSHNAVYFNETLGRAEELTPYEYECVLSFYDWYTNDRRCGRAKCKRRDCLVVVAWDFLLWPEDQNYAGTGDIKVYRTCDGAFGIIDIKTSKNIYKSHRAQVQAYRRADPDAKARNGWGAILQLGVIANARKKYRFTIVKNGDWRLFVTALRCWQEECADVTPHQKDYPLQLVLPDRVEQQREVA